MRLALHVGRSARIGKHGLQSGNRLLGRFRLFVQKRKQIQSLEVIRVILGRHDGFQRKATDIVFLVAVEAIGTLVFYGTHGIVVSKIAFIFVVLDDSLGPVGLVPVGFRDEEHCFGGTFLVVRETLQHAGTFFDYFFILLRFFAARIGLSLVRDAIQTRRTQFGRFVVEPFRIEHVIQICTTRATIQQGDKQEQRYKTT